MTSKVLVQIPGPSPFSQQVKKSPAEVIVSSSQANSSLEAVLRVGQLEQNIKFLQDQHAKLLSGLHREIDTLRQKNRDLQFQLVFSRRKSTDEVTATTASTARDEESPTSTQPTGDTSTKPTPTTPDDSICKKPCCRQLEKEITKVRAALEKSQATAVSLQSQLNENKKKEAEEKSEKSLRIAETWSSNNAVSDGNVTTTSGEDTEQGVSPREAELQSRLTEAEKLVSGLRQQGERQRREVVEEGGVTNLLFDTAPPVARNYLASIKASLSAAGRGNSGGGGGGNRNGGRGGGHQQRFPPLQNQSQTYWQQREDSIEQVEVEDATPVRKRGGLKGCFVAFGRLSKSCAKPSPSREIVQAQNNTLTKPTDIPKRKCVGTSQASVKAIVTKIHSTVETSPKNTVTNKTTQNNGSKNGTNSEYGCWSRSNHRRGNEALPDVRGTNAIVNYNNGNNGNSSQQGGRNSGSQGYCNQYFRNNDRGGGHRNTNSDESYQKRDSNEDLSDGEVSSSQPTNNRGGHSYTNSRYKRGHHRQNDNS